MTNKIILSLALLYLSPNIGFGDEIVNNSVTLDLNESKLENIDKREDKIIQGLYRVKQGDVFSKIAYKFGFSTKELLDLNHIGNKDALRIGQEIKIPLSQKMVDAIDTAKYTIEQGDTILSIAIKFKIESKALLKFNHLESTSIIREGKTLDLPLPYVLAKLALEKKIAYLKEQKEKALAEKKAKEKRLKANINQKKIYYKNKKFGKHRLRVTATAYTSHRAQTDATPFLAAWNNRLRPGMKIIAVSRDLLSRYGLRNGTKVKISGLHGYYRVRDKMNKRFKKRIDIYMGRNKRKALRWGRRSVVISW